MADKGTYEPKFTDEEYERHYEVMKVAMERILGPMHDLVGHAKIPFQLGGTVDMYYFPNAIEGTGCATIELIEPDGSGPKPNRIGTYELIMFTKHSMPTGARVRDNSDPFNIIQTRICAILTCLGNYSYQEKLEPGDTCEVQLAEGDEYVCVVFDEYSKEGTYFEIRGQRYCLLLCIEVFREEMEFAMEHGSSALLSKLKDRGHYPYSDLDRAPVV